MRKGGGGIKLEKNSIIRLGRIRLRVRDIDYPEAEAAVMQEVVPKKENMSPLPRRKDLENESEIEQDQGKIGEDGGLELAMPDTYSKMDVMLKSSNKKQTAEAQNEPLEDPADKASALSGESKSANSDTLVCRICLDSHVDPLDSSHPDFNPMISPCGCTGTVGGIHLKCLRGWLESNK